MELAQTPQVSDAALVARCRAGDELAWVELVDRFSRYVYAIAVQVYRLSQHDAEDVFQETFARTYERLGDLRDDAALKSWIAQVARRLSVDRLRTSARVRPSDVLEPAGADDAIDVLDEALTVHEALATLPDDCQEVLDRFFVRDQSYATIAEALEIPPGTIASRISRSLAKLRMQLSEPQE